MMRRTTEAIRSRRQNVALLLLVVGTCCPLKPGRCDDADCDYAESYDKVVTVNVTEPVHVTRYKWCLDVPPRCPDHRLEYRTVRKNVTIPKTRTVRRCCKDQIQLYDNCVPRCAEDQCPNVQCAPGTDKCKCKPGYTGHLCRQKCAVGRWGPGCRAACDSTCSDCDHRTGCCRTPGADVDGRPGSTLCAAARRTSDADRRTSDADRRTSDADRRTSDADGSAAGRFDGALGTRTAADATWEPASAVVMAEESDAAVGTPAKRRDDDDGGEFARTVRTKMEATVYKYDELVKRLVWISSMTVAAIAMVFVIAFVVFFNRYGVPKVPAGGRRTPAAVRAASDKIHETCIGTQNMGHVPPDRYTRSPALRTLPTNTDLPIHPEIFCPVFSAPHYPGSTLYDSPQPLYEILC